MPGTNTDTLTGILGDIADEIRAKDGTQTAMTPAQMPSRIAAIPSGGGFDWSQVKGGMRFNNSTLQTIDVSGLDTSTFNDMSYMFSWCSAVTSLDLSGLDTSSVTTMERMFSNCQALTSVNVTGFDTSHVTTMENMFYGCFSLTSLDLGSCDTSNATTVKALLNGCTILSSVNLAKIDASSMSNSSAMNNMFNDCGNLSSIIWAIDKTSVVPLKNSWGNIGFYSTQCWGSRNGYIYVPDSLVSAYQADTYWSDSNIVDHITGISNLPAELQTLYDIDPNDYQ